MTNRTSPFSKKISAIFLQMVVVLIGVGTLALMLWEPHLEGRNLNATLFEIYFNDPFLAYAYLSSIPFFVALYKAFTVLGYVARNTTFSQATMNALLTIQYCAITLIGLVGLAEIFIVITASGNDDIVGGVAMGLFAIVVSIVIAAAAAMFEGILENAGIQSKNRD